MTPELEEYILTHIDKEDELLASLDRNTHLYHLRPRMVSGHLQGRILKMFCRMIRPHRILELGTFTGYSALCLAEGLTEGGEVHTIEIDDEIEDFTRSYFDKSPLRDRIKLIIGDASDIIPALTDTYRVYRCQQKGLLEILRARIAEGATGRVHSCRQYPMGR